MFDIGFSEILVIAVVALIVIGPERLPKVARTLGHLFGRMQRYVTQVKSDIHRAMELAELGKVKREFETAARSFASDVQAQANDAERGLRDLQTSLDRDLDEAAAPPPPHPPPAPASPQLELGIDPPSDSQAPRRESSG